MKFPLEILQGQEVGRNVFADGGMRAAARLHRPDAFGFQSLMADEKLAVFPGEYVVGHRRQTDALAQLLAKRQHQRRFAAPHRSAHAYGKRALLKVAGMRLVALMKPARMIEVFVVVPIGIVLM